MFKRGDILTFATRPNYIVLEVNDYTYKLYSMDNDIFHDVSYYKIDYSKEYLENYYNLLTDILRQE